ncbi:uncharacterized protein G2W53_039335 [Senna tora]|uniref:Uncharacterized protein n=1 Tax=Senna tora TaxID=362788 RepID=A0A834SNE8_9FABA|nr:uncharacterized protein G2W53_039335 [Senna tora]
MTNAPKRPNTIPIPNPSLKSAQGIMLEKHERATTLITRCHLCLNQGGVFEGGTQHRKSGKGKNNCRRGVGPATDGLSEKMNLLLKGLEDHRRETREAFQIIYRNQLEIAEAGHITLDTILSLYFTESYPAAPTNILSNSGRGNETMVALENDDEEMVAGDSEEF